MEKIHRTDGGLAQQVSSESEQLTGSEHLKFTLDIWNPDSPKKEKPSNKRVTINRTLAFAYLDMEFY